MPAPSHHDSRLNIDSRPNIDAVLIVVPARNEEDRIEDCTASLTRAIAAVDPAVPAVIVVASDDSTDTTERIVDALSRADRSIQLLCGRWNSAGGARRAGVAYGLTLLAQRGHRDLTTIWIATTDADTVVPPDWLSSHLQHANAGFDGVAGVVDVLRDCDGSDELLAAFRDLYTVDEGTHLHVHGANLGVRASAYLAVDGFAHVDVAEDHALWNELRRLDYRVVSPLDVRVMTSGRLIGRAVGGFADTLAAIMGERGMPGRAVSAA